MNTTKVATLYWLGNDLMLILSMVAIKIDPDLLLDTAKNMKTYLQSLGADDVILHQADALIDCIEVQWYDAVPVHINDLKSLISAELAKCETDFVKLRWNHER